MRMKSVGVLVMGLTTVTSLAIGGADAVAGPAVHHHHYGLGATITHSTTDHQHSAKAVKASPADLPASYSLTNYSRRSGAEHHQRHPTGDLGLQRRPEPALDATQLN